MSEKFKAVGLFAPREYKLTKRRLSQTEYSNYGDKEKGVWVLELEDFRKATLVTKESAGDDPGVTITLRNKKGSIIKRRYGFSFSFKRRSIGCAYFSRKDWEKILKAAKVKLKG